MVNIIPREASRQLAIVDLQGALDAGFVDQAQAAKSRGRSDWVGATSFGRLGRLGLAVLKHLQYHGTESLLNIQRSALRFHQRVVTNMPPQRIKVGRPPQTPLVIYSDAEYEPDSGRQSRVGWVLFECETNHHWDRPFFWNSASLERGKKRTQQIFLAEEVAFVIGTWSMRTRSGSHGPSSSLPLAGAQLSNPDRMDPLQVQPG